MTSAAASRTAPPSRSRSRWATMGWVLAVLSTVVTGLVVGYGVLWFQFGSGPVVEDYQISAGGYGTAAALLLVSVPALLAARRRILATATGVVVLLYAGLSWNSWLAQFDAVHHGLGSNDAWDGIGGVLLSPTTWPLLFLALQAPYHRLRHRRRPRGTSPVCARRIHGNAGPPERLRRMRGGH